VRAFATTLVAGAALILAAAAPAAQHQQKDTIDWVAVGQALGIPATPQSGGVWRIDIPRTDLNVHVEGSHGLGLQNFRVRPFFALGGYLVFLPTGTGTQAMMMGDLVLTESELEPVMLSLEQSGVDVAAIHNHILWEKPTVMYMHLMVTGDPVQLATAVHNALALTHTPLTPWAPTPKDTDMGSLDATTRAALDQIIGVTGKLGIGVYKYSIAPTYPITSMGMTIPPSMGMNIGLTFQPLGNGNEQGDDNQNTTRDGNRHATAHSSANAAVTGDIALLGNQVNPVIKALRANGIYVTALHSHMLESTPTVLHMHFLATGDAITLAHGLRAALDAIAANPPA
jgi:hypothetical protein